MNFPLANGTTQPFRRKDLETGIAFSTSLTDCFTNREDLLNQEIAKRETYLYAKDLSNFHDLDVAPPISPCWWSRIRFGLNKTPEEIQEVRSIEIDLDAIKQSVFEQNRPKEYEMVRLEVSIHLEDPYNQPNYMIPLDVAEKGGVISIDRKDLLPLNIIVPSLNEE